LVLFLALREENKMKLRGGGGEELAVREEEQGSETWMTKREQEVFVADRRGGYPAGRGKAFLLTLGGKRRRERNSGARWTIRFAPKAEILVLGRRGEEDQGICAGFHSEKRGKAWTVTEILGLSMMRCFILGGKKSPGGENPH